MNIIEGVQEEIKRVNKIIEEYDSLPGGAGQLASHFMKESVKAAESAIATVDTVKLIQAYADLKEYEL